MAVGGNKKIHLVVYALFFKNDMSNIQMNDNNHRQQTTTKCYFSSRNNIFVLNDRILKEKLQSIEFKGSNSYHAIAILLHTRRPDFLSTGYGGGKFSCYAFAHLPFLNVSVSLLKRSPI